MRQYTFTVVLQLDGTIDVDDDDDPREAARAQAREDLTWNQEWWNTADVMLDRVVVDRG